MLKRFYCHIHGREGEGGIINGEKCSQMKIANSIYEV
jgi:hypothetical protein